MKAVDVVWRGEPLALAGLWAIACLVAGRAPRVGAGMVAVVAFSSSLLFEPSNHTTLIGWVGLIVAFAWGHPASLSALCRGLAGSVYLFATANKLTGSDFIDGTLIAEETWWQGAPVEVLAPMAVATQAALLLLVLRRCWLAAPLALALHAGIVVLVSSNGPQLLRLTMFNGLTALMVAAAVLQADRRVVNGGAVDVDVEVGQR